MKNSLSILDKICGLMELTTMYSLEAIKEKYIKTFNDVEGSKKIAVILRTENKKVNSKVCKVQIENRLYYKLNDNFNFDDQKAIVETKTTLRLAQVIYSMIHKQNLEVLDKWLNEDLIKKIDMIIESKLKQELRNEVAPAIEKSISDKIKQSKGQFKKLILELISDIIKVTESEG